MMQWRTFQLCPVDTLFFRDARPMQSDAGSGGHGANWPLPTTLHEALRAELLRRAGHATSGRTITHHKRSSDGLGSRVRRVSSDAFNGLRILGPFPLCAAGSSPQPQVYLPRPRDLVLGTDGNPAFLAPAADAPNRQHGTPETNFPAPWLRRICSPCRLGKNEPHDWIGTGDYVQCLNSEVPAQFVVPDRWITEHRINIKIASSPDSDREGNLFASEHLRLREGTSLWFQAALSDSDWEGNAAGLLRTPGQLLPFGGESRLCRIVETGHALLATVFASRPTGCRIKWVLSAPAVFTHGWRPNWICGTDGRVLLKAGEIARKNNEDRLAWRRRVQALPEIAARLVAALIPKPLWFSGWDLAAGGPKPTQAAVPAGAVYYFEADGASAAAALVRALHGRTLADCFGEKGMGLGFCGSWQPLE
jgi:CRISPR-associated protein Cmr3